LPCGRQKAYKLDPVNSNKVRMDFKMAVKNGDFIRIDYTESVDG
jgi:FKBP-type peptidyl-prolyl cis-trans isomerase (trigger factor)